MSLLRERGRHSSVGGASLQPGIDTLSLSTHWFCQSPCQDIFFAGSVTVDSVQEHC